MAQQADEVSDNTEINTKFNENAYRMMIFFGRDKKSIAWK